MDGDVFLISIRPRNQNSPVRKSVTDVSFEVGSSAYGILAAKRSLEWQGQLVQHPQALACRGCSLVRKQPQDDALAVKADKISVEEARCCFETSSASAIHNK